MSKAPSVNPMAPAGSMPHHALSVHAALTLSRLSPGLRRDPRRTSLLTGFLPLKGDLSE